MGALAMHLNVIDQCNYTNSDRRKINSWVGHNIRVDMVVGIQLEVFQSIYWWGGSKQA